MPEVQPGNHDVVQNHASRRLGGDHDGGAFDLAYVVVTPCSLTTAPAFHSVPWTVGGRSFELQVSGRFVTAAGAMVGFVLGWVITKVPMGHR